MMDVFLSYSAEDRERVQPIRDSLAEEGFEVFWDREAPPGHEYNDWIRQHIDAARCVIVFWSWNSVESDEIAHEALIAKNSGKLIPAVLEPLDSGLVPMGHSTAHAALIPEEGVTHQVLQRLCNAVETRVTRPWMRRKLAGLEGQILALTSTQAHLQEREASHQARIGELEGQIGAEREQKAQIGTALEAAKAEAVKAKELAASAVMLQQTILRLDEQLGEEITSNNKLRAEAAQMESRIRAAKAAARESASAGASQSFRDVYLLIATILLLLSAANGSTPGMVISSMLLMAGILVGFFLR
jgi:hypothetical protein